VKVVVVSGSAGNAPLVPVRVGSTMLSVVEALGLRFKTLDALLYLG